MVTSNYRPGDVVLISDPGKGPNHQVIGLYTSETDWPVTTADGDRYSAGAVESDAITVLRVLRTVEIEDLMALSKTDRPESDEPEDDEAAASVQLDAARDRLQALQRAAEYVRTDGVSLMNLSQSPERAQTRRVIDAAKWVLNG